jgi:hypothetical protein
MAILANSTVVHDILPDGSVRLFPLLKALTAAVMASALAWLLWNVTFTTDALACSNNNEELIVSASICSRQTATNVQWRCATAMNVHQPPRQQMCPRQSNVCQRGMCELDNHAYFTDLSSIDSAGLLQLGPMGPSVMVRRESPRKAPTTT